MKKLLKIGLAVVMMVMFSGVAGAVPPDSSQTGQPTGTSVLPSAETGTGTSKKALTVEECQKIFRNLGTGNNLVETKQHFAKRDPTVYGGDITAGAFLGCGIKTGDIHLWMVPYYLRYILEFVIALAGLISVGGIVYGGFIYIFSGISKDTEKGKKALIYSIIGMILTLVAWAVVNIVIVFLTQ
ncbi:MAG: pilin [Candidatus Gracilibacteria bacterium]